MKLILDGSSQSGMSGHLCIRKLFPELLTKSQSLLLWLILLRPVSLFNSPTPLRSKGRSNQYLTSPSYVRLLTKGSPRLSAILEFAMNRELEFHKIRWRQSSGIEKPQIKIFPWLSTILEFAMNRELEFHKIRWRQSSGIGKLPTKGMQRLSAPSGFAMDKDLEFQKIWWRQSSGIEKPQIKIFPWLRTILEFAMNRELEFHKIRWRQSSGIEKPQIRNSQRLSAI